MRFHSLKQPSARASHARGTGRDPGSQAPYPEGVRGRNDTLMEHVRGSARAEEGVLASAGAGSRRKSGREELA